MPKISLSTFLLSLIFGYSALTVHTASAKPVSLYSPDHQIHVTLESLDGQLSYSINVGHYVILPSSSLGVRVDGTELGQAVKIGQPSYRAINQSYKFWGAHTTALNKANEVTVPIVSHGQNYWVDVHAANDGVAVRLRLNAQKDRHVEADRSVWRFAGNPTVWADVLGPEYETPYKTTTLANLKGGTYGMPLTLLVQGMYVTVTEAALKDYGDLALLAHADGALEGQLYADKDGWKTDEAVVQPWRVTLIARNLTDLVNSTLVQNLNPPPTDPELATASWIKPGRSSWQWLSSGDPVYEEQRQWVDWTKQLGFEYYLIDEGWARWKDPWAGLSEVVPYATKQNVKIWVWVHSNEVTDREARRTYFRQLAERGVVGVKIDFPPPTNRTWSSWYFDAAKDAAEYHLMVDFHGATKPTGMERTWPNVLTREGVRGHEWQITRYNRQLDAEHDTILPFTRYVAGPGDYTPTVFRPSELLGNTWAHELAQAITFTSPFLCFGGHPQDYLNNPAKDVLMAVPATWDETRILPGSVPGKVVAEARRKGKQWFIAVINGGDTVDLDLSLAFLGSGKWSSTQLGDVPGTPAAWDRKEIPVTGKDRIHLTLAPKGGFVARIQQ